MLDKDKTYVAHTYNRFPVAAQSGRGATAKDFAGKEYIDFGSGIGTHAYLNKSKHREGIANGVSNCTRRCRNWMFIRTPFWRDTIPKPVGRIP